MARGVEDVVAWFFRKFDTESPEISVGPVRLVASCLDMAVEPPSAVSIAPDGCSRCVLRV